MNARTEVVTVVLTRIDCGVCGGVYAITERHRQHCYERGKAWTCPYCKTGWGFTGNSENQELKRQLDNAQKRIEWAEQDARVAREARKLAEHQARAQKAAKIRLKNRVANGVCPCCNRTFANLAKHMAGQHPGFAGGEA